MAGLALPVNLAPRRFLAGASNMALLGDQSNANRSRMLAQQLLAQGARTPRNVGEGLMSIGGSLAGALMARNADASAREGRERGLGALHRAYMAQAGKPDRLLTGGTSANPGAMAGGTGGTAIGSPSSQGGNPALLNALMQADPDLAARYMFSKLTEGPGPKETFTLKEGVDPKTGQPAHFMYGNHGNVRPFTMYTPVDDDVKSQEAQQQAIERARAGAQRVNVSNSTVNPKGPPKFAEVVAKGAGEFIDGVYADAENKRERINSINRFNRLLDGINTGPLTAGATELKALFNQLAPDTFDPEKIANVQAAKTEAGKLVMKELNAMKGPATENERAYLEKITIDVSNTPEARQIIAEIADRQAERAEKVAEYATDLAEQAATGEISASRVRSMVNKYKRELERDDDDGFDPGEPPKPGAGPKAVAEAGPVTFTPEDDALAGKYGIDLGPLK